MPQANTHPRVIQCRYSWQPHKLECPRVWRIAWHASSSLGIPKHEPVPDSTTTIERQDACIHVMVCLVIMPSFFTILMALAYPLSLQCNSGPGIYLMGNDAKVTVISVVSTPSESYGRCYPSPPTKPLSHPPSAYITSSRSTMPQADTHP
jgi:hypothetical protein